ncbi:hypothetical protein SAMN04488109_1346 [Chryseolinea serpens]|uniref:Uncharacterized protein n=1 Tax=Chryseolinea serpens TaxID=947013 RepID=A0A1M5LQF6_9BACT|nr:hypothetical protein SAMN04488109_1346 [Chryseolinea serpens]
MVGTLAPVISDLYKNFLSMYKRIRIESGHLCLAQGIIPLISVYRLRTGWENKIPPFSFYIRETYAWDTLKSFVYGGQI